jgi:hypothetical protein
MNIIDYVVELRAQYRFKTPDAIQLGTAVACGADYILTNFSFFLYRATKKFLTPVKFVCIKRI